jgi:hypothetical protein
MDDVENNQNNQSNTYQDQPDAYQTNASAGYANEVAVQPDAAGDATGVAAGPVSSLVGQVKEKAVAAVSGQKDGIADRIEGLANTVHDTGGQFAGKQDRIAGAIERGANELGSLATSLRNNDLSSLLTQAGTLARKQPALFVGASLVAGFAIARLGKIVVADASRDDLPTLPEVGHGNR